MNDPMPNLTLANAKAYTENMIREIEKALITEIEKIEGKVPSKRQMAKHGVQRFDKVTGFTEYLWKGRLIVTMKPGQVNVEGRRGTMLEINQIVETK
jgi:hypothetical protein